MHSASAKNKKNKPAVQSTLSANAPTIGSNKTDATHWRSLVSVDNTQLHPISGISAALKRLEDFVLGSFALLILFPLMALISIAVKLDSTGPALFCQARSGRNREIIKVYKFRTMYQSGVQQEFRQAERDDPTDYPNWRIFASHQPR